MNRLISFFENKIIIGLIIGVCILFVLTIREKMILDETMSLWRAAVLEFTLSESEDGYGLYLAFLIKVTLAWAVIRIYVASAGLSFDRFSARRFSRDHVIIIAESNIVDFPTSQIGRNNFYLAFDLALNMSKRSGVVFVAPSVSDDTRARLWSAGVKVLDYQKNIPSLLRDAGTKRAKKLVAMRSELDENIAICRVALAPEFSEPSLKLYCQIPTQSEMRRFNPEFYYDAETLVRFRSFNESQMIARDLLRSFPPDQNIAPLEEAAVHIGLFGFGEIGQAIVEQFARVGHYRSGKKAIVSIFAKDLKEQWQMLLQAFPNIEDWLEIRLHECSEKSDFRIEEEELRGMIRAYVCHINEVVNLRLSKTLVDYSLDAEADLSESLDVVAIDPPGGTVLSDFWVHGRHNGKFHSYSLANMTPEQSDSVDKTLISEEVDRRARLLHEAYVAKEQSKAEQRGEPLLPNVKSWEDLKENVRDSNRRVADHFEVKVRALGCHLVPRNAGNEAVITSEDLEMLAEMEHNRWWADRALNGWTYGQQRDDRKKVHPNMVPYEALSESDKQKDRDFVLEVAKVFRHEGLIISEKDLG
ncbi:RyR domain-containing protein [Marinobacter sp. S6332]|uniref:RyR domain-containing protein n=1 Tax=Marinobacter sp. S6332 TaxID=2926403 RepID=UPI001FF51BB4|nr:RyR domain-containing protein [Marinobacter sp. S6332]MCK0165637.1 RyR domain-containing protein [Marinobacter sp. S6332]